MYQNRKDFSINGAGQETMDAGAQALYVVLLNPTGYSVNVYRGSSKDPQSRVAFGSIYSNVCLPLPVKGGRYLVEWVGGTGQDHITIIFSDTFIPVNQTMVSPGGSSTMIISGDSVGLARQTQLPVALGPNGGTKVEVIAQPAGTSSVDTIDRVGREMGLTDVKDRVGREMGLTDVKDRAGRALGAVTSAQLPAALAGSGGLKIEQLGYVGVVAAITPTLYAVALATANTQVAQTLPAGTRKLTVQARTTDDVRLAYVTGKVAIPTDPYFTIKAGSVYFEDGLTLAGSTIFLASAIAGVVVEIIAWSY